MAQSYGLQASALLTASALVFCGLDVLEGFKLLGFWGLAEVAIRMLRRSLQLVVLGFVAHGCGILDSPWTACMPVVKSYSKIPLQT